MVDVNGVAIVVGQRVALSVQHGNKASLRVGTVKYVVSYGLGILLSDTNNMVSRKPQEVAVTGVKHVAAKAKHV